MRIISGEFRGRVLKSPTGFHTRPTSDRLRETLFNIIRPNLSANTRFLDLCAGTGAVGIEAISRGAGSATFVDISRQSCALIEENLDLLKIPNQQTEIICASAEHFVNRQHKNPWDIVYFDPPYLFNYSAILQPFSFQQNTLILTDSIFIAEHHLKNQMPDSIGHLRRWRLLKQGENCLSFYELK